jgi:hypothetical protein
MKNTIKYIGFVVALISMVLTQSCSDSFLDKQPTDNVSSSDVFTSTEGGVSVLNGIYRYMYSYNTYGRSSGRHDDFGQPSVQIMLDVMGDDMPMTIAYFYSSDYNYLYTERSDYSRTHMLWNFYYDIINNVNGILDNKEAFEGSQEEINYVLGQAYTLRAFSYFYLVNLYQQTYKGSENAKAVPVYLTQTTDGDEVSTVQKVYDQITADIKLGVEMLENANPPGEPDELKAHASHIDVYGARALYARIALQMEDWTTARDMAKAARSGKSYRLMSAAEYTAGFNSADNPEWLWGFKVNVDDNAIYPSFYSHMDPNQNGYGGALGNYKQISQVLYDRILDSDVRKQVFKPVNVYKKDKDGKKTDEVEKVIYYQYKFISSGNFLGDLVQQRLAEAYLIEAECEARLGNDGNAQTVLFDLMTTRDSEYVKSTNGDKDLLDEILLHRQIELWGEGRRWFDIKRLKIGLDRTADNLNDGLARIVKLEAGDSHFMFPIPQLETDVNGLVEPNK